MRPHQIILLAAAMLCLGACAFSNRPPDPGTPTPAAHDGVFAAGEDSFQFNGDGKSISWQFAQPFPPLPAQGSGTYVFLFHNESWRYDAAEKLRIIPAGDVDASATLVLNKPATETTIEILVDGKTLSFTKQP